ncbi:hypothetical protein HMPREF0326_05701 [Desulfovibrio sp. 3_1_syn3]|nr:hypothetical protein HMPREF0326_05701 [Desulfovibrio sp. 3_1_syn3]
MQNSNASPETYNMVLSIFFLQFGTGQGQQGHTGEDGQPQH